MSEPLIVTELPEEEGSIPCPDPQCGGSVVEVDVAMRWNFLEVAVADDGTGSITASTDGEYDWERRGVDGFICDSCLRGVTFSTEPDITYD